MCVYCSTSCRVCWLKNKIKLCVSTVDTKWGYGGYAFVLEDIFDVSKSVMYYLGCGE